MNANVTTARNAENVLVSQLHATADALAEIGQSPLEAALERVRLEADALKGRVKAARAAVACELAGVLQALSGLTEDLEAGLAPLAALPETAQEEKAAPALPAPGEDKETGRQGDKETESETPPAPAFQTAQEEKAPADETASGSIEASPTPSSPAPLGGPPVAPKPASKGRRKGPQKTKAA